MTRKRVFIIAVAGTALALTAVAPSGAVTAARVLRYTGTAQGGDTWKQHFSSYDNPPSVVGDSNAVLQATFTFSFAVSPRTGRVTGTGQGQYTQATWHMQGQDTSSGAFNCDVPLQGPSFSVSVSGRAIGKRIRLSLLIPKSADATNDTMPCGGDFYAYGGSWAKLRWCLSQVGGSSLVVSKTKPSALNLSKEITDTEDDQQAQPPTQDQNDDACAWTINVHRK
jgi:hypothetical protein